MSKPKNKIEKEIKKVKKDIFTKKLGQRWINKNKKQQISSERKKKRF